MLNLLVDKDTIVVFSKGAGEILGVWCSSSLDFFKTGKVFFFKKKIRKRINIFLILKTGKEASLLIWFSHERIYVPKSR